MTSSKASERRRPLWRLTVQPVGTSDKRPGVGNLALYVIALVVGVSVFLMRRMVVTQLAELQSTGDPLPSVHEFTRSLTQIEIARLICLAVGGACLLLAVLFRKRVRGSILSLALMVLATGAAVALPQFLLSSYRDSVHGLRAHTVRLLKADRHEECLEYAHSVRRIVERTDAADDIEAAAGGALFHLGRYKEAQEQVARMLAEHPQSDVRDAAIQTLGWTMARLGRLESLDACRSEFVRLGLSQYGLSLANYLVQYRGMPPRVNDFASWTAPTSAGPGIQPLERRAPTDDDVLLENVGKLVALEGHDPLAEEAAFRAGREDLLRKSAEGGLVSRLYHYVRGERALQDERYDAARQHFGAFLGHSPMRDHVTAASRGLLVSMCRRYDGTRVLDELVVAHGNRVRGISEECIALVAESFAFSKDVEEMAHAIATHHRALPIGLRVYLLAVLRERIFVEGRDDLHKVVAAAHEGVSGANLRPILSRHERALPALKRIGVIWSQPPAPQDAMARAEDLVQAVNARVLDPGVSNQHVLDATFQLTRKQMNHYLEHRNYPHIRNHLYTNALTARLLGQLERILATHEPLAQRWGALSSLVGHSRFIDDIVASALNQEVAEAVANGASIDPKAVSATLRFAVFLLIEQPLRSTYVRHLATQDAVLDQASLQIVTHPRFGISEAAANALADSFLRTRTVGAPVILGLLGRMKHLITQERLDRLADMWMGSSGPVDQVVFRTILGWHEFSSTEALGRAAIRVAHDKTVRLEPKTMRRLGEVARHLPPKSVRAIAARNLDLNAPMDIQEIAPYIDKVFARLGNLMRALDDRRIESDLVKEIGSIVEIALSEAVYADEWTERTFDLAVALERVLRGVGGDKKGALFHRPALQRDIVSRVFDMYTLLAESRDDRLDRKAMIDIATLCLRHRTLLPEARRAFQIYLEMFPDDPLRENCHSWLAWIACFRAYEHKAVPHMFMRYYRRALEHYGWIVKNGRQARVVLNARVAVHTIRRKLERVERGEVLPHQIKAPAEIARFLIRHQRPAPSWRRTPRPPAPFPDDGGR